MIMISTMRLFFAAICKKTIQFQQSKMICAFLIWIIIPESAAETFTCMNHMYMVNGGCPAYVPWATKCREILRCFPVCLY